MWQEFSAHHYQRGDVTAVVWGAPGAAPREADGADSDVCRRQSSSTQVDSQPAAAVVNAEELTRGRRAETPFVQQCDLVFPLPDRESGGGGDDKLSQQEDAVRGGRSCRDCVSAGDGTCSLLE